MLPPTRDRLKENEMAEFYGSVQGARGEATRLGHKSTGLKTKAASYQGAVEVNLSMNDKGVVIARVELVPHLGHGTRELLYEGPVGERVHHALNAKGERVAFVIPGRDE